MNKYHPAPPKPAIKRRATNAPPFARRNGSNSMTMRPTKARLPNSAIGAHSGRTMNRSLRRFWRTFNWTSALGVREEAGVTKSGSTPAARGATRTILSLKSLTGSILSVRTSTAWTVWDSSALKIPA